mmetsp:Transcript_3452/g.5708  ORF Transcript_3452/g.5708 Transcript_3452/m.5708 type:complete len:93 (+) Transcript_3452:1-279(+)
MAILLYVLRTYGITILILLHTIITQCSSSNGSSSSITTTTQQWPWIISSSLVTILNFAYSQITQQWNQTQLSPNIVTQLGPRSTRTHSRCRG